MFEGLDDIDWASLEHAYGSAEDVPDLVRSLNSDDSEERGQAYYEAFGNIFHQGSRYQATAPTVPFLLEILAREDYEAHDDMMYLLAHLVMGYGEAYLPEGFMPAIAGMRYELAELRARSVEERAEEDEEGEWASDEEWLGWIVAITDEVRRGVPRVIRHLGSDDERVRIAATFLLSWLPEDFDLFAPSLWQLVADDPSDHVRADALIALAIAGDEAAFAEYIPEVEALLSDGEPVVQFAAAIALGTRAEEPPDAVVQVLLDTIAREGEGEERDEDDFWMIPWYDGEAGAYATEVLRWVSADAPERVTHAVAEALSGMQTLQAANAASSIVAMLFPDGFDGESAEDLDPLQRMFLERLAETPNPWMLGDATFANFALTLGDFGLPDSMEKMQEFLASV